MNLQMVSGMPLIWAVLKSDSRLSPSQVLNQPLTASHLPQAYPQHPPIYPHTPPPHTAVPPILLLHQ